MHIHIKLIENNRVLCCVARRDMLVPSFTRQRYICKTVALDFVCKLSENALIFIYLIVILSATLFITRLKDCCLDT